MIDVLTEIFRATRGAASVVWHGHLNGAWGLRMDKSKKCGFHLVVRGRCFAQVKGGAFLELEEGDLILLPRGYSHTLRSDPEVPAVALVDCDPARRSGGPTPGGTTLLCGSYRFEGKPHPILSLLPELVHVKAEEIARAPRLASALGWLVEEVEGQGALAERVLDVVFLALVRSWLSEQPAVTSFLGALRDDQVGRALRALHERPEAPWTVESLAKTAGLSRATFARRFAELVGEPPLTYLTRVRVDTAARLLRETTAPLAAVASRVGYSSEFAFSKAFKRWRGVPPIEYRREPELHFSDA